MRELKFSDEFSMLTGREMGEQIRREVEVHVAKFARHLTDECRSTTRDEDVDERTGECTNIVAFCCSQIRWYIIFSRYSSSISTVRVITSSCRGNNCR